jgi:hypothetical protein
MRNCQYPSGTRELELSRRPSVPHASRLICSACCMQIHLALLFGHKGLHTYQRPGLASNILLPRVLARRLGGVSARISALSKHRDLEQLCIPCAARWPRHLRPHQVEPDPVGQNAEVASHITLIYRHPLQRRRCTSGVTNRFPAPEATCRRVILPVDIATRSAP